MALTRKLYWETAMKGGTVIGLTLILLNVLKGLAGSGFLGTLLTLINIGAFAYLIYYFTRKAASMASPAEGFPYGRCVSFTVAMMLFVGVLMGLYLYLNNNFFFPAAIEEVVALAIDNMMNTGLVPDSEYDTYFDMMLSLQKNPFMLIFAGIITYVIYGLIVGLITSALAKRNPDVFAEETPEQER